MTDIESQGWIEVVSKTPKVELLCKEATYEASEDQSLKCNGVLLLEGDMNDFKDFGGIRIIVQESQELSESSVMLSDYKGESFKVDDFTVEILQRRLNHVYYLTVYKYLFVVSAMLTAFFFYRSVSNKLSLHQLRLQSSTTMTWATCRSG